MSEARVKRQTIADAVGVKPRTITNWRSGVGGPDPQQLKILREILGPYDLAGESGDAVERALADSGLTEDRQLEVLAVYKRKLREQDAEAD